MIERSFALVPFPSPDIPAVEIQGKVSVRHNLLAVSYTLTGDVEEVLLAPASPQPGRRDELWQATCFEFFLARENRPDYWEFNLSPSGNWNVYRMDDYRRRGFRQETRISQLPFTFKKGADGYLLDVAVDLAWMNLDSQDWEMAIAAIVQTKNGSETYWALAHPASKPDFHLRAGFTLSLAGQTHPVPGSAAGG